MWQLSIQNIAGIRNGRAALEPGLNVVQASNWQGKSSFLASIQTAMGTVTALTDGADTGSVTVETDSGTVEVSLSRQGENVVTSGSPFLTTEGDRAYANLFAFLGEDNPVRTAVRRGENLEDVLTRPLDFENIDEQIAQRRRERESIETELEAAERARERLPPLQERVTSLESDLEDLRDTKADLEDGAEKRGELAEVRERLGDMRAERDQLRSRVEQLTSNLERVNATIEEKQDALADLDVPETDHYEARIEEAQADLEDVQSRIDVLTDVYNANSRILDEELVDLVSDVDRGLMDDTVACWVCGEEHDRSSFESRLAAIDDVVQELRAERATLRDEVEDLRSEREEHERIREREANLESEVADLQQRRDDYEAELASSRDRLSDLEDDVKDLEDRLSDLEDDVDETESRITEVESEIKYTEAELEDARSELAEAEAEAERVEELIERREEITDSITDLRTRKDRLKQDTRERFDDAMAEILPVFEPGFEHARLTAGFDLVIARDGREVPVDVLSEGEVELLGFVAAAAGHEAFGVSEHVPVILLDELGGLATEHLHHLVTYFREKSAYVVTTAYPEAGEFDGHVISPDEWSVVGDDIEQVA